MANEFTHQTSSLPSVAQVILDQLGGGRAMFMIGGTPWDMGATLQIRFTERCAAGINCLRITLNAQDTYDIEGFSVRGKSCKSKCAETGVFAEELVSVVEDLTGLLLSLRSR